MAIQTFVASTVLTAAQMNALQANDYNQTVSTKTASYTLVAADKGTRVVMNSASATTITVNTSLFSAGDTLVLQNISTGVCTVTAGTATVSTAGSLAIPQNGSGILYFTSAGVSIFYPSAGAQVASGFTLVSSTTIGTTVSSVTVSSAFSATYDNYKIILSGGIASANSVVKMTLGATATGYSRFIFQGAFGANTVTGSAATNQNDWGAVGSISTNSLTMDMELQLPFLTKRTTFYTRNLTTVNSGGEIFLTNGFLDDATSYTAFTLTTGSGTMTGGTIKVYGYANS